MMKHLEKLKYFLGIEVAYSRKGIFISQRKYVLNLPKETSKLGCRPLGIPIEVVEKFLQYLKSSLGKRILFREKEKHFNSKDIY